MGFKIEVDDAEAVPREFRVKFLERFLVVPEVGDDDQIVLGMRAAQISEQAMFDTVLLKPFSVRHAMSGALHEQAVF